MRLLLLILLYSTTIQMAMAQALPKFKPARRLVTHTGIDPVVSHASTPRTVRVLALRVQFKQENPDNPSTTGNGHFDLGSSAGQSLDPPPHNKNYFEDHLLALRNYFLDVSDSHVVVDYTVKPDGLDDAVTLDTFMAYYGILGTQEQRDVRLAEFFNDAIRKADAVGVIDFSGYDHVIIFHAGVGQDFSTEDDTPNDLASRFVSPDLMRERYPGFNGIPVTGGIIHGGVVVPETESQTLIDPVFGLDVFTEIGLTGILCANFGSAIGMPDLFNTETGQPGIGVFGLEDQGAVNGDGLIPAEPDPWTKIYMGWTTPLVVMDSVGVLCPPKQMVGRSRILKIPINASEYFLIENKQRDLISNALSPAELSRIDTINNQDGSQTYDTVYAVGVERSPVTGVITKIDEYDGALPGNGLLIWHIDENVIRSRLTTNTINNDIRHRGVRLMEASGSQDIGYYFSAGPFSSVDAGNRFDYYYKGNEAFAFYNRQADSTFLTPTSVPNSLANDRSYSGISLTNVSEKQPVMSFDLKSSALKRGFPVFSGNGFGHNALAAGNISGGSESEVVGVGQGGEVLAWQWSGQSVVPGSTRRTSYGLGGDSTSWSVAFFARAGDSVLTSPALGDLDEDGLCEVIVGDKSGRLYVWRGFDADHDEVADTLWTHRGPAAVSSSPVMIPGLRVAVGYANGDILVLDAAGALRHSAHRSAPIVGLSVIGSDTLVVQTEDEIGFLELSTGLFTVLAGGNFSGPALASGDLAHADEMNLVALETDRAVSFFGGLPGWPFDTPDIISSSPSVSDIDQDGFLEVIFGSDNAVYAYNHNGTLSSNFPIVLDRTTPAGRLEGSVLIADVSGDGESDVIAAATDGKVYAFDRHGRALAGFPLATGSTVTSTPVIIDWEGDGTLDIVAASEDGFLYAWSAPNAGQTASIRWGQWQHDAARTSQTFESHVIPNPGESLMPKRQVYNYPNPARGHATTIRYYLAETATVKIRIFDMAGDLVTTLTGTGVALTENEVSWNLGGIQSGVYFAKVEARGASGRKVTRTIKIAVTK